MIIDSLKTTEFPARKKTHSFTKTLRHTAVVVGIPLIYPLTVLVQ